MPQIKINRLRVRRAELDITQSKVAAAAGMHLTRFWQIENSEGTPPKPEEIKAICRVLKAKADDLFPAELTEFAR